MSGTVRLPTGDIITIPVGSPGALTLSNAPADVTVATITSTGGHLVDTSGTPVAAAAGANNGASPPAPIAAAAGTDTRGSVTFGSGTTPAAGAQVVITFSTAFAAAPVVVLAAGTSATAALNVFPSAVSTTGFTVSTVSAPAASQGGSTYRVSWIAVG